jgi:hypothetical protein
VRRARGAIDVVAADERGLGLQERTRGAACGPVGLGGGGASAEGYVLARVKDLDGAVL